MPTPERRKWSAGPYSPAERAARVFRTWADTTSSGNLRKAMADAITQAEEVEREQCARVADYIAGLMEQGAGEANPGERCRQIARKIRERKSA